MGIGFTIDTPVKVAQYGISSVISLVDDLLMEKMREFHSLKLNIPFEAISNKIEDFRAKRITAYLNLIDKIVKKKFEELKNSALEKGSELKKHLEMLPAYSKLIQEYNKIVQGSDRVKKIQNWLKENLSIGSIDVNIMTKLDKANYNGKNEELPAEYNDAHAALRGFALSDLESSIIFSAGLNPRLYGYIENFDDFYPDEKGFIKKKIILKVSDYRSAIIQGKFLAKKGLWVSEYRIESSLNCGGHTFVSDGYLLGPILEEFKKNRETLIQTTHEILVQALKNKNRPYTETPLKIKITTQGGIGTAEEHQFLIDYYKVDGVGWATPFLVVPEVTNVDNNTIDLLCKVKEEDLYLSDISPMGIPFRSVKGNTKDIKKQQLIEKGKPGSSCPKKLLTFNSEFTKKPICTASFRYQNLKRKELETKNLSPDEFNKKLNEIVDKSCLCVGLGTSALLANGLDTKVEGKGVSVCPGPNMAYFSKKVSLKNMVDHIYGKANILDSKTRPNMFIKEIVMYIDYLKNRINKTQKPLTDKQIKYFDTFKNNLMNGIKYYRELTSNIKTKYRNIKADITKELKRIEDKLSNIDM